MTPLGMSRAFMIPSSASMAERYGSGGGNTYIKNKKCLINEINNYTIFECDAFNFNLEDIKKFPTLYMNNSDIEHAFEMYLPEVHELFKQAMPYIGTAREKEIIHQVYERCTSISIDYGVMEKASNVHVLASDFGWSDLGTWGSLFEQLKHDENNNAVQSPEDVFVYNSNDCIISTPKGKVVVVQGLQDYIVSESGNTLLICKKSDEQQIRQFVNDVQLQKGDKYI